MAYVSGHVSIDKTGAIIKGRVGSEVDKRRSVRADDLVRYIANKRIAAWKGWEGDVVIDEVVVG